MICDENFLKHWLAGSVHSVAEALLLFLECLPDPVIPCRVYYRCLECNSNYMLCKQVSYFFFYSTVQMYYVLGVICHNHTLLCRDPKPHPNPFHPSKLVCTKYCKSVLYIYDIQIIFIHRNATKDLPLHIRDLGLWKYCKIKFWCKTTLFAEEKQNKCMYQANLGFPLALSLL